MLSKVVVLLLEAVGLALIVAALALIWVPLALIGGGLAAITVAYRVDTATSGASTGVDKQ